MVPDTAGQVVALDGKTLRRSHDRANGQSALHLVSAWACGSGLVLGQVAVDNKSNESAAIPALLRLLALDGATVTIDALGCQTAIAAQIVAQGGDYILVLKNIHPTLHNGVRAIFAEARATAFAPLAHQHHCHARAAGKGHGRLELRRTWVITDPAVLALGLVESERRVGAKRQVERRHYLLSAPMDAATFAGVVRRHWVLDVPFNEDASRVRVGHAAQNLAIRRRLALNLLRQDRTRQSSVAALLATAPLTVPSRAQ